MRGGALPPALLCAALGFALAFAPRRMIAPCLTLMAAAALAASLTAVPTSWDDAIFFGCWLSVVAAASAVHLPGGVGRRLALGLSLNTGLWCGAVIALAGARRDLLVSLPLSLLCLPGHLLVARGRSMFLKVPASWLIAVALLAVSLQLAPTTPGYRPDHMD